MYKDGYYGGEALFISCRLYSLKSKDDVFILLAYRMKQLPLLCDSYWIPYFPNEDIIALVRLPS